MNLNRTLRLRISTLVATTFAAATVAAHEGHGSSGAHWHATDVWGFIVLAAIAAGAVAWWRGRD